MFKSLYLWLLIAAVLLLSTQIIAVVIYIYSFVPLVWSDAFLKGLEPTRDTLFYAVFLSSNVVLTVIGGIWILPQLESADNRRRFKFWLCLESVWCFLMIFCFFKWTTYRYPFWNIIFYENVAWLQPFFCVVCAMSLLSKIFFPEVENLYRRLQVLGGLQEFPRPYVIGGQVLFIAGVILLLYIPHPQDVTALGLAWDQWNHLDRVAGWFIKHGWFITYEQTVQILIVLDISYIIGLFYFIRAWLKSWFLAAVGALLAIKLGMFYYGSMPCIWINPANTFLSHGWDIFLLWGLWLFFVYNPKKFYLAAGVMGVLLVCCWVTSNGTMGALGLDNQPMMAPLRVRQFFPYLMGYFIPLFYVFSLLVLMGQKTLQNASALRMPVVMCIYGLMIFIDYLEHPMIGFYGSLMVPAILVMLWWVKQYAKRGAYAAIFVLVLGALLTNRLMLTYPNFLFQDKNRFARERNFYEQFGSIAPSAALIRSLTTENQKIALISNFETALLMQAHRQPLFKDFPVMFSSINEGPGGLNLATKKQCLGLINSLAEENALYVFVDARLLKLSPQVLENSGLGAILNFLNDHYAGYKQQGFLVAYQRR